MTERASTPLTARKGRRPHPARNARLISTGAAASLTFGVVVALAFSDASAASRASAAMVVEQGVTELAPISTSVTPTPATIMVIRRVHYLPATATVAPVPQAAADAVVFSPQPAVRAGVATASPRKASGVRRVVVRRRLDGRGAPLVPAERSGFPAERNSAMTEVLTFAAMGTTGHLEVSGPHAGRLARSTVTRIDALGRIWSRFLPSSDVSRLNASGGNPVSVHRSTIELLDSAVAAWRGTEGRFSPFLQRAMLGIGYRRSLSKGPILVPSGRPAAPLYVPITNSPLHIDRQAGTVILDPGAGLDLGGIAKGFSADLVLAELVGDGAVSALVDIGGDMAFATIDDDDRGPVRGPLPWTIRSNRVLPSIT